MGEFVESARDGRVDRCFWRLQPRDRARPCSLAPVDDCGNVDKIAGRQASPRHASTTLRSPASPWTALEIGALHDRGELDGPRQPYIVPLTLLPPEATTEAIMVQVTRRELLQGAAALGAAATVVGAGPRSAWAQTPQKRELAVAQGGDIS